MQGIGESIGKTAGLMRSRVTKYAIIAVIIAAVAVIIATMANAYIIYGAVNLETVILAQKENVTLWVIDAMPFIFAIWGQYASAMIAYETGVMVFDQTQILRDHAASLEHQAQYEATHDPLTNLPNRILLRDRLDQAVHAGIREQTKHALLILDIDHFKEINDTLGHYSGDRLLRRIALRLKGTVRDSDTVARLGGDEFGVLLRKITQKSDVEVVIAKILKAFKEYFLLDGMKLVVQVSIGVAVFPEHGKDADTLLQRADVAMYAAKNEKSKYAVYSTKFDSHNPKRLTLMGELKQAIENQELTLYFQPKIEVAGKHIRINGAEALVRWPHEEHGIVPPDEFIPLAERTGLIDELTYLVLKNAIKTTLEWHRKGLKLGIAVNVSPSTLLNYDLPDVLTGLLANYDVAPNYVTLEITEGTLIKNPPRALEILNKLSEMGIRISIDDFGTGYSSLAYLRKMPVSEVKIDKSFVIDMLNNESDAVIVKATIELAHNLGMKVTAEGVETFETVQELRKLGCDCLQGYYFSRPCSKEHFMQWVRSQKKT